jgi:folate-binding protein YgfZ
MQRCRHAASEINAASVFFPVAVTRRVRRRSAPGFDNGSLLRLEFRGRGRICDPGFLGIFFGGRALAYHLRLGNHPHMLSRAPMPFKPIRQPEPKPRLDGYSLLGFSGPDAGAFLQAQTMNDVKSLEDGCWHWNGWLSPKGRVIALFALLKLDQDEYIALLPDFPAQQLLPLLQRYVFRSKVRLQEITDLVPVADLAPELTDSESLRDRVTGTRETGLALDFGGKSASRRLLLLPESSVAAGSAAAEVDSDWMALDMAYGLPRLPLSQSESWTPQMLSLERLKAFSVKKGCYPGQEIVARTHFLGQAKRRLHRLLGRGLEIGESLGNVEGDTIGKIICATPDGSEGLAVLQADGTESGIWLGDQRLVSPDFLEGLARPV